MSTINKDVLLEFKRITNKDLVPYFEACRAFFNNDYNTITAYYQGNISKISSTPFNNFDKLEKETSQIFTIFDEFRKNFKNLKWWLLIEQIENIDSRLKTLRKINKWARSSLKFTGYSPNMEIDHVLQQNQTIERVSQDVLGSSNPNDDWFDIAFNNNIIEEEYTPDGGVNLTLNVPLTVTTGFKINSVVDIIQGKSIYGKDVDRIFAYENDDLRVLSPDDTIKQAVDIMSTLRKNDNPSYPYLGLQSSLTIGGTRAMLNFPIIFKQMSEIFATDDTLKNFTITKFYVEGTTLYADFTVETRLGELIEKTVAI